MFLYLVILPTNMSKFAGALLYKFRSLFIIAPIYLSLLIAIRAMRIEASSLVFVIVRANVSTSLCRVRLRVRVRVSVWV